MPQIDQTVFFNIIETLFYTTFLVYLIFMLFFSINLFNMIKSNFYFVLGNLLSILTLISNTAPYSFKIKS